MRTLALVVAFGIGCDAAPRLTTHAHEVRGGVLAPGDGAIVAIGTAPVGCTETLDVQCTGTLIGPRAVLTAAHCARIPGRLAVFVGPDVTGIGEIHDVALAIVHPDYVEDVPAADLAVLVLATAPDIAPLAMAGTPVDAVDAGRSIRALGFGAIDETGAGVGVRRQASGIVAAVSGTTFRTTPGEGITCNGDSGGPVLIDRGGGEVVAGVTSQGDLRCETYADNVDVAAQRAFIDEALATAAAWTPAGGAAATCQPGCVTDEDCALGLECDFAAAGDRVGFCVVSPLPPGALDGECTVDDQCASGTCARVPGEQACRCHAPCDMEDDGGCQSSRGGAPGLALLVLLITSGLRCTRGRADRRRAATHRRASCRR